MNEWSNEWVGGWILWDLESRRQCSEEWSVTRRSWDDGHLRVDAKWPIGFVKQEVLSCLWNDGIVGADLTCKDIFIANVWCVWGSKCNSAETNGGVGVAWRNRKWADDGWGRFIQRKTAQMETNCKRIKAHLGKIKAHLGKIKTYLGRIKTYLGRIKTHLGRIKAHLCKFKAHLGRIKAQLSNIKIHLRKIKIHLDKIIFLYMF